MRCARLLLVAILLLLVRQRSLASGGDNRGCVWKITGPNGGTLYLGGSVHALRSTDYPLPPSYNRAFDASQRLVFEVAPDAFVGFDDRMSKVGRYPRGDNLKNHIDPRIYEYLRRLFGRLDMTEAKFSDQRPWYLALRLQLPGSGPLSSLGIDNYLAHRAYANHKPVSGLESAREHLEVFSGLSDREGEAVLLIDLINYQENGGDREMTKKWRRGEVDALVLGAKREFADFPAFAARLLGVRNRNWIPKIERDLRSGRIYFVVVGAGHLGGPNGLLTLLRHDGFQTEQL